MSSSVSTVVQARNNAWRYWNSDGLSLITQGFALTLLGLAMLLGHHQHSILLPLLLYVMSMTIQIDQIFKKKFVSWLKTHITYPRTGYVALPGYKELMSSATVKEKRRQKWTLAWLLLFLLLSFFLMIASMQWYLTCAQIVMAGLLGLLWIKFKFAWYVPMPLAVGAFLLLWAPVSNKDKLEVLTIQIGVLCMLMGMNILANYLREHPAPETWTCPWRN